jgi:hypothetical protein
MQQGRCGEADEALDCCLVWMLFDVFWFGLQVVETWVFENVFVMMIFWDA